MSKREELKASMKSRGLEILNDPDFWTKDFAWNDTIDYSTPLNPEELLTDPNDYPTRLVGVYTQTSRKPTWFWYNLTSLTHWFRGL